MMGKISAYPTGLAAQKKKNGRLYLRCSFKEPRTEKLEDKDTNYLSKKCSISHETERIEAKNVPA